MRQCISHVQIPVKNVDEAMEWYEKVLDCERLANFGEFAVIRFKDDKVTIFLWKSPDENRAAFTINGQFYPIIGFEVDDMDRLISSLPNGVSSQDEEGRRFFKFFDLDGNMLVAHTP